ncbi:MAG: GNAT family N-acetyltransferase [Caldilineaceae bacterium]
MSSLSLTAEKLDRLGLTLKPLVLATVTETEWNAINELANQRRAEDSPGDPPRPLQDTINGIRHIPPVVDMQQWFAWHGTAIVASCRAAVLNVEQNQHILDFDIFVLPAWRRQGIATELLKLAVKRAQEKARTLLLANTESTVSAGEAFCEHIGAEVGLTAHENQLVLANVDRAMLQAWIAKASERADDLELGLWDGPLPESELAAIITMMDTMNNAPREDLKVEDFKVTPEILRQGEASMAGRGIERWILYVRDPANGVYAGYTEVFWRATEPHLVGQGDTGVVAAYRNRGIGRWLKAAMLEKILQERPQVKYVRTGNAASNEAMLKVNHELGFTLHKIFKVWQVERSAVENYLRR